MHPTAAEAFFDGHRDLYEAGPHDRLTKHLASWKCDADQSVLLFLLLREVAALRADVAALLPKTEAGR
jgi:hypothetical protein